MRAGSIHGADEVLCNVFWDLGQIGDKNGPKYPDSVLRRLAAKILDGRAHELLVFRLCHLIRCADFASEDSGPNGWLEFFCAPGAGRPGWAAGWLRARLPAARDTGGPPAAAATGHVVLRYSGDARHVTISYGSIPLLVAFMEFLLNTLHYRVVRDSVTPLSKQSLDWRELQDTANGLSRATYAWLQAHRRPVQESRDFEAIANFLAGRRDQGDFSADDVDDEAVLAFWRTVSAEYGSAFRTFRKTFRAFLRFVSIMREGALREGIDSPSSLDDWGDGSAIYVTDPSSPGLDAMRAPTNRTSSAAVSLWGTGEEASPLEEVAGAEIKFLMAGEAKRLSLVDAHARLLPGLARSVLRDARFGQVQSQISQRLRMNNSDTEGLFTGVSAVAYDDELAAFEKLLIHLEDLIDVAAFILVGDDSAGDGDNVRRLDTETLTRGRRTLKGLRRRGFDELRSGSPEAVESLRRTTQAIIELRDRLAPLCARLRAEAPWLEYQEEDEPVFREQFTRIYGIAEPRERETAP